MKKIKNRIKNSLHGNNRGFSLTELIVCTAILGVIAVCVSYMMNSGTRYYTKMNKDVNVAHRTQIAMTQIREFFIDCDALCMDENGEIFILNTDKSGNNVVYSFMYDSDGKEIKMNEYSTALEQNGSGQPFAKNISDFEVSVTKANNEKKAASVTVKIEAEYGDAKYKKSQVFSLKNVPIYVDAGVDGGTIKDNFKDVLEKI